MIRAARCAGAWSVSALLVSGCSSRLFDATGYRMRGLDRAVHAELIGSPPLVHAGETREVSFQIVNASAETLVLRGWTVAGSTNVEFAVSSAGTQACRGGASLPAGESCRLRATFAPVAAGEYRVPVNVELQVEGAGPDAAMVVPLTLTLTAAPRPLLLAPRFEAAAVGDSPSWGRWVARSSNALDTRAARAAGDEDAEAPGNSPACTPGAAARGCLHASEFLEAPDSQRASCAGVTLSDALGAFNWGCRPSGVVGGGVVYYSRGLKPGKGLADLVGVQGASAAFRPNFLNVFLAVDGAAPRLMAMTGTLSPEDAIWWGNPVSLVPAAPPGGGILSLTGDHRVHVAAPAPIGPLNWPALELCGESSALVALSGTTLTHSQPGATGFVVTASDGPGSLCASKFPWIEVAVAGRQGGVLVTGVSHPRLHRVSALGSAGPGVRLDGVVGGLVTETIGALNSGDGIEVVGATRLFLHGASAHSNQGSGLHVHQAASPLSETHVSDGAFADNAGDGVRVSGVTPAVPGRASLTLRSIRAYDNAGNGIAVLASTGVAVSRSLAAANDGMGFDLEGGEIGGETVALQLTAILNGGGGARIRGPGRLGQVVALANGQFGVHALGNGGALGTLVALYNQGPGLRVGEAGSVPTGLVWDAPAHLAAYVPGQTVPACEAPAALAAICAHQPGYRRIEVSSPLCPVASNDCAYLESNQLEGYIVADDAGNSSDHALTQVTGMPHRGTLPAELQDWSSFQSSSRLWVRDSSLLGSAAVSGACADGLGPCAIFDLKPGLESALSDASERVHAVNSAWPTYDPEAPCGAVPVAAMTALSAWGGTTVLWNAYDADPWGNGLCETGRADDCARAADLGGVQRAPGPGAVACAADSASVLGSP